MLPAARRAGAPGSLGFAGEEETIGVKILFSICPPLSPSLPGTREARIARDAAGPGDQGWPCSIACVCSSRAPATSHKEHQEWGANNVHGPRSILFPGCEVGSFL